VIYHDVHRRLSLAAALGVTIPLAPRLSLATALGLTVALVPAGEAESSARCGGAPRAALLCLVNAERAAHGVRALRWDGRLSRAATRHARDMVRHGYVGHQRGGGAELDARLARAGWHGSAWGETIAYGCGRAGSPRRTVRSWMASSGHRAVILSGAYGRAGIGLARRAPVGCGGRTWVLDVGRR
jgi:uncharacterized protein YkwD